MIGDTVIGFRGGIETPAIGGLIEVHKHRDSPCAPVSDLAVEPTTRSRKL
jgi:hypothetical protein